MPAGWEKSSVDTTSNVQEQTSQTKHQEETPQKEKVVQEQSIPRIVVDALELVIKKHEDFTNKGIVKGAARLQRVINTLKGKTEMGRNEAGQHLGHVTKYGDSKAIDMWQTIIDAFEEIGIPANVGQEQTPQKEEVNEEKNTSQIVVDALELVIKKHEDFTNKGIVKGVARLQRVIDTLKGKTEMGLDEAGEHLSNVTRHGDTRGIKMWQTVIDAFEEIGIPVTL